MFKKHFQAASWPLLFKVCNPLMHYIRNPHLIFLCSLSLCLFSLLLSLSFSPVFNFTLDSFSVFVLPSIYAPLFGPTAIRLQRFSPPLVQADNSTRDLFATQLSGWLTVWKKKLRVASTDICLATGKCVWYDIFISYLQYTAHFSFIQVLNSVSFGIHVGITYKTETLPKGSHLQ